MEDLKMRIACMPLVKNVPQPKHTGWVKTKCPKCGAECWRTSTLKRINKTKLVFVEACTECAIKEAVKK